MCIPMLACIIVSCPGFSLFCAHHFYKNFSTQETDYVSSTHQSMHIYVLEEGQGEAKVHSEIPRGIFHYLLL